MSDVSLVTKYFPTANEGFIAYITSAIAANAAIVPLSTVAGLVNGSVFVGIIDPGDAVKQQVFTGTVDTTGVRLTGCVWTRGTSVAHSLNANVVDYTTGTDINMIVAGILKQHAQDGTHTNVTATTVSVSGSGTFGSASVGGAASIGSLVITGTSRLTPASITSSATITPSVQIYNVTALAVGATINVPSFTANDGMSVLIRIKDNGIARALAFAVGYSNVSGLSTPTATIANKLLTVGAVYNSATSKWEIQGINQEA